MESAMVDFNIGCMQKLILKPILFNDLKITLVDALNAFHESGWSYEEHRHPWFEFNYVKEGKLMTTIEGKEFATESGAFFLVAAGAYHSNQNKSIVYDDGFCLRWQLEVFDNKEGNKSYAKHVLNVLSKPRAFAINDKLIEKFMSEMSVAKGFYEAAAVFTSLIMNLYKLWNEDIVEEQLLESREDILVKQALLYLLEYYREDISVLALSHAMNVSYRHLARAFKQRILMVKMNIAQINHNHPLSGWFDSRPIRAFYWPSLKAHGIGSPAAFSFANHRLSGLISSCFFLVFHP
jgi:hypothetical protein